MNYKQKITLSNKHHVSSAIYHLERVMPDDVIGKETFRTIKEQLKLWERDLQLAIQNDSE
jgi:hypothetical protein